MTANEIKHRAKLQEWAGAIQECRSSGLTVREWCRGRGVTTTTYYRWERRLLAMTSELRSKPQPVNSTTFAELPAPQPQYRTVAEQGATVRINDVAIEVCPGMDAELLKMIINTVRTC